VTKINRRLVDAMKAYFIKEATRRVYDQAGDRSSASELRDRARRRRQRICPGEKRDGRCSPGAWLCRLCKRWHYLERRPVRRGTAARLADALPRRAPAVTRRAG
jgi:hypothetical protein